MFDLRGLHVIHKMHTHTYIHKSKWRDMPLRSGECVYKVFMEVYRQSVGILLELRHVVECTGNFTKQRWEILIEVISLLYSYVWISLCICVRVCRVVVRWNDYALTDVVYALAILHAWWFYAAFSTLSTPTFVSQLLNSQTNRSAKININRIWGFSQAKWEFYLLML